MGYDLGLVVAAAEAFEPVHGYGDEEFDVGEDVGVPEVEGELRGEECDELWGVVVFAVADELCGDAVVDVVAERGESDDGCVACEASAQG